MQKSLLSLYLQRVADGDESYLNKLLLQLAERLVYIPIEDKPVNDSDQCRVKVQRIKEAYRSLVPLFTQEELLKKWCTAHAHSAEFISLLGADLSAALSSQSWVWVNPDSESAVELQPFMLEKLKSLSEEESSSPAQTQVIESDLQVDSPLREPHFKSGLDEQVPLVIKQEDIHAGIPHTDPEPSQPAQSVSQNLTAIPEEKPAALKKSFLSFLRSS